MIGTLAMQIIDCFITAIAIRIDLKKINVSSSKIPPKTATPIPSPKYNLYYCAIAASSYPKY